MTKANSYIPALRFRSLTRFYDTVVGAGLRESVFRRRLVEQVRPTPQDRVLDLGCGTATLSVMLARAGSRVTGVDADPEVLALGRRKADRASQRVRFVRGFATQLPLAAGGFDRAVSSLFFHHLSPEAKAATFLELFRVLSPGGELHVADWGRAPGLVMRAAFLTVQLLDGFSTTADNVRGRLPEYMTSAGFRSVQETGRHSTVFGSLSFYRAIRP